MVAASIALVKEVPVVGSSFLITVFTLYIVQAVRKGLVGTDRMCNLVLVIIESLF